LFTEHHASQPPLGSFSLLLAAQQGIFATRRKIFLHLASHPSVLPPVQTEDDADHHYTEGDQPNLQFTHVFPPVLIRPLRPSVGQRHRYPLLRFGTRLAPAW